MKRLRTVFFGTPDFAVATLEMLAHHPLIELVHIVSMPDRPAGRGQELKSPEVIKFAKNNKLAFFQTANVNRESEFVAKLESEKIDCMIVLAFAQFLGERVLKIPRVGCFNIHTSLLPKYRGAAPIQYALWNGDKSTGVSIQKMVKKMDAGDIVHAHPVPISENETGGQLTTRLKFQAALACNDFIENLYAQKVTTTSQDESAVSFAPTLKKSDGWLDFGKQTKKQIINRIHAMDPWPGTFCFVDGKRLKILQVEIAETKVGPNQIVNYHNTLVVGCVDGSLRLCKIQLEGKKPCTDTELLNGWRGEIKLSEPTKDEA